MIEISKNEAAYLRKVVPNVHITRTAHKRYVEEVKAVLTQLPGNVDAESALKELNRIQYQNSNFDV